MSAFCKTVKYVLVRCIFLVVRPAPRPLNTVLIIVIFVLLLARTVARIGATEKQKKQGEAVHLYIYIYIMCET